MWNTKGIMVLSSLSVSYPLQQEAVFIFTMKYNAQGFEMRFSAIIIQHIQKVKARNKHIFLFQSQKRKNSKYILTV